MRSRYTRLRHFTFRRLPSTTASCKAGVEKPCRAKERFVRCKAEQLLSSLTSSRTLLWSLAESDSRNLCPPNFPLLCSSSGNLACEPHEEAGSGFSVCLQFYFTSFSYILSLASFPLSLIFFLLLALLPNLPVQTVFQPSSSKINPDLSPLGRLFSPSNVLPP